jgi:hypothetical protein
MIGGLATMIPSLTKNTSQARSPALGRKKRLTLRM